MHRLVLGDDHIAGEPYNGLSEYSRQNIILDNHFKPSKPMRLDRLLSRYGYCSRAEAPGWLRRGRVSAEGKVFRKVSEKASPQDVRVDAEPIQAPEGYVIRMHKPAGLVCSHEEREGPRVYDLLPEQWMRRDPQPSSVGRLDKDTTGVLLITDRGDILHRLASPKAGRKKIYHVKTDREIPESAADIFASGELVLNGEKKACAPAHLEYLGDMEARLTLTEGKYHQVKRMFASQGCKVIKLHREGFGEWTCEDLQPGEWQMIELDALT